MMGKLKAINNSNKCSKTTLHAFIFLIATENKCKYVMEFQ